MRDKNRIMIKIYVKPRSSKTRLVSENGDIIFYTNAKPEKNEANKSLIKYISNRLGISASSIKIVSGYRKRVKIILIENMDMKTFTGKRLTEDKGGGT